MESLVLWKLSLDYPKHTLYQNNSEESWTLRFYSSICVNFTLHSSWFDTTNSGQTSQRWIRKFTTHVRPTSQMHWSEYIGGHCLVANFELRWNWNVRVWKLSSFKYWVCGLAKLVLTHQMPKLSLYRNQSIDLLYKWIDWCLYDGNFGI